MWTERSLARKHLRLLVGSGGLLVCSFWGFGFWGLIIASGVLVLGGRTPQLDPEDEELLAQILRDRATCRRCKALNDSQAVFCFSCRTVVHWGPIVAVGVPLLFVISIVLRILYASD
jgi:hypothetical protein